jgi:hypothetical protein
MPGRCTSNAGFIIEDVSNHSLVMWPKGDIPVEIFAIIVSSLSRLDVQNMRLVNKEFEDKVSQYLFKTVVVPFKPEIYGIAEETAPGRRKASKGAPAVMLQDKGMRVFQGFGRHIHKFAMSFEFDYDLFTKPPLKSDQEAITTFWGIYRWPYKGYHRYETLEGLEQTADETRTMAKALRFIKHSQELGLSIDGGLGWISGPDTNSKNTMNNAKPVVFGPSTFTAEQKLKAAPSKSKYAKVLATALSEAWRDEISRDQDDSDRRSNTWLQMLREAGYEGSNLAQSVQTLRESEGIPPHVPYISPDTSDSNTLASLTDHGPEPRNPRSGDITDLLLQQYGYEGARLDRMRLILNFDREERRLMETEQTEGNEDLPSNDTAAEISRTIHPLKPNDLTNAQKEMLLETEWAQRAFLQSYAIAVIDNPITFQNVHTLTIARLPSRHLSILRREDFWESLSNLKTISLAVIPDWRDVIKLPTSWVDDVRVSPSQAINGVYRLFKDHIAPKQSIKTLKFEWLCGGEEAPGLFARNQHILAAPLLPHAINMMARTNRHRPEVLNLPYIQHLTLKNCWANPHVISNFVEDLKKHALQSLTLHSVSLSAPVGRFPQPPPNIPLNGGQQPVINQNVPYWTPNHNLGHYGVQLLPNAMITVDQPSVQAQPGAHVQPGTPNPNGWLDPPRPGSWAYVIDRITPHNTLECLRYARDAGEEPPAPEPTELKVIKFFSCGYVRLPAVHFDQSMLDPPEGRRDVENNTALVKRRAALEQVMMKSNDATLAIIVNHISEQEVLTLENAWNLSMGWGENCKALAIEALADGLKNAGQGRFRGRITKPKNCEVSAVPLGQYM